MSVPFIDLKRFESGFLEKWFDCIKTISTNAAFIGGEEVELLEEFLKENNSVKYAITCANGTDALQLALRGAEIGPDDKVLIPDTTFWATFEAVVNVGAVPSTVDINPKDLQMDFELFKSAADAIKPRAAILVHLYGWASGDLLRFRSFCSEKGIILIEDGAQCYGTKIDGEPIYKDALLSTISFYPAKVFGAAGDAGAVLTNNEKLGNRIRSLANHGRDEHYAYGAAGWNSRMDSLQAAYLNLVQPHLKSRLASRKKLADKYRDELEKIGVRSIYPPEGIEENGYLNVSIHSSSIRRDLTRELKRKNIGFAIIYPDSISDQKGSLGLIGEKVGGGESKRLATEIISLPLFPYMTPDEFDKVIESVREIYSRQ